MTTTWLIAVLIAARWTQFVALFVLFGWLLFPFYAGSSLDDPSTKAARKTLPLVAVMQVLSLLVWLGATIAGIGDGWDALADAGLLQSYFLETGFGQAWIARLALTFALVALVFAARASLCERNLPSADALALVGLLLASGAEIGHQATAHGIAQAFYTLHVWGGAAWIGGLAPLFVLLREARNDHRRQERLRFALKRYAKMASCAVALVIVGGASSAWATLADAEFSTKSPWAWALAVKIVCFFLLLAIAFQNRFRLGPLLVAQPRVGVERLARNIMVDQGIALVLLLAAAVIGLAPSTP